MEQTWYTFSADGSDLRLTFHPAPHRFWPPNVLSECPLPALSSHDVAGRTVVLTGPAAVWMYAHAAAFFRARHAGRLVTELPSDSGDWENLQDSKSMLTLSGEHPEAGALLTVQLPALYRLSNQAKNRLLEPRLEELRRVRPKTLVLSGRASVDLYARAAWTAVDCGVERLTCWSARDGLIIVYDQTGGQPGEQITRPSWLEEAMPKPVWPVILGVAGDPNRGKSVFSRVLDCFRHCQAIDGWLLDCDGQAPTPSWFLSMVDQQRARQLRDESKRPWTSEMEERIAEQLRRGRDLFSVLIADLPGGKHSGDVADRVPRGRERIFAEVDALILLDDEQGSSERFWRDALAAYDLERRIIAVLRSHSPKGAPVMTLQYQHGVWRGEVTALDRARDPRQLARAYGEALEQLWSALIQFARRGR